MPETITLKDGTTREVPTEEELKELHERSDARKTQREELKGQLDKTTKELEKLKKKDYDYKKLRDMTKEELEKLSSTEIELKKRQEKLEEEQQSFTQKIQQTYQDEALAVLAGNDKATREKVMHNYGRIKDNAVTKEEINNKMRDAFNMLGSTQTNSPNPINQAINHQGGAPGKSDKPLSNDQKGLAKKLGITDDDLKKSGLN